MQSELTTHNTEHLSSYLTGFILAVVLTAIPFGLVAYERFPASTLMPVIVVAALVQVFVHMKYFLHLDFSPKSRGFIVTILFTVLIIAIMVGGTVWVIYDLNANMMPS